MHKSTYKKAQIVRLIVSEWYEPERQDRCKEWVYRNKVRPALGISQRTFWRYLDAKHDEPPSNNARQLCLNLF